MMKRDIRVCIIGAGRAGMIHAVNFRKNVPNAVLAAIADPNEQAAKQAAESLGIHTYYTDYKEALKSDAIDAVVVVTPTIYHRNIVVEAAEAGKHVLCEKPMGMIESECEDMIQAANNNRVKLQIGFMRRFNESFMQAKEEIEAGLIGDVVMVRSLTRGPSIPQPWMYDLKKSNGPLAEVNSHDIDTLRWFIGAEFESVYAIAGNYRCPEAKEQFPDFYDNVVLNARFTNQKQGVIDGAVSVKYGYDSRVEILGTEGVIFIGQVHEKTILTANRNGITRPVMNSWRSLYKDAYLAEDAHFVECILEDKEPKVTGHDGKMAVSVVNAGNKSIKEGQIVRLTS
ncbi:Gfo/Idh/MocA family oxidoreductase [Paenibacillus radicis (ex Xue et al. 2023)]|uniref:Gfo/Idh/MocA family oxidoreductase n=1 Tax=Paenibacillus radicis (ex Xue et al. 2023) TaxID=2972489 RepID=A0ABT1YIP7_9BACL|nr:Gfo/Idh/MocA family oxidoreductase [Paenibacillus radicis (ex Xue et al. 2023)]MCR8633051.1 Gfo/Idh/MocA family oxidoreductase [Paenibacillus radicis (ex Xue et al. 2023)]